MQVKECNVQTSSTRIVVIGAAGRMGSRICALAQHDPGVTLAGAVLRPGSPGVGTSVFAGNSSLNYAGSAAGIAGDVLLHFAPPGVLAGSIEHARAARAALLVGTTGLPDDAVAALRSASGELAVLLAPNTSLGVSVLADAAARAAGALGPGYRASIVEAHHSGKRDAPSGTALRLADTIRRVGGDLPADQVLAIRAGDIIGEHTIRFAGPGEVLEFTHRATSRDLFARGALRAATWLAGRAPGWYTMDDALGIGADRR